jgi:aldehyde:ferredoxin oxidoreductase
MEMDFNRRAGFTAADDRMPEFMLLEKLPPHNQTFTVSDKDLDSVMDFTR